jgi:hypothetical protein
MRVGRTLQGLSAIGALLLTLTAGCTISIQPWTKPVSAPSGPVDLLPPNPNGPYRQPPPGGMLPISPTQSSGNNETITVIGSKLMKAEDDLNVLQAHMMEMKREKTKQDQQLTQAAREIELTLAQIKHLRKDLSNWKTDVDEMNNRIETLEKTRGTMKLLLEKVSEYIDRENKTVTTKSR